VGSALSILRESNEAELVRRVQLGARLLVVAAKDAVISQDLATLDSLVAETMISRQVEYVRILDAHGSVLAQRGEAKILARPFHQEETVAQARDGIFERSQAVLAGGIRHGEVQVGVSVSSLQVLLVSAQRWAGSVAVLEILMVALFSWLLGTYLVRQLGALRQASERFAAGDFEHRVVVKGDDELAQTANAFNAMAQQLSESREQLQVESSKWRNALEKTEKAESLLSEAISSIPQGFTIYDEQDRLVQCNEAYLRFYESSRDLIVPGQTFEEIVRKGAERGQYSAATGDVDAWVRKRVAQHQQANGEMLEQRLADGRWLLIVEYRTPSGYIVGNRIDITERKQMEQALLDNEQRWELAVTGANDGIWDWNPQSGEVYFSERWKTMLGYRSDEIGSSVDEWVSRVHPDDLDFTMSEVQRHLRGETDYYQNEHRMRCKNGEYKWILDRGRALIDEQGQAVRMLGSHSDITERRALAVREREYAEQLGAIFELSPDGFVSFDGAGRVKYLSPAFTRLTGLTQAELVGLDESAFSQRLAQRCLPEACFPGVAALRSRKKTGLDQDPSEAAGKQLQIEMADAGNRVLEVSLREKNSESVKTILYLRDITHEAEVDRLKSEFLSTAAHELRTPMTSIYGFTELLLTQDLDEADWREYLQIIFRHSESMISIINELLDLARIEARHGKDFQIVNIDVLELLQEILAGFKTIDGRAVPPVPRNEQSSRVMADRKKLIQAVLNVLSNAYKYSPAGGAVELDIVRVAEGADSPLESGAAALGVRIADHGMGMTPEQLARVFERFYRADTSGKIPGTGLGMSIVQEIVALHGGKVSVASAAGLGTTVTIWLPTAGMA